MRKLILLLLLLPVLAGAQSVSDRIKTDRIYSRVGRGIGIYDTLFIKKGIAADSLENIQGIVCRNESDGRLVYITFSQFADSIGGAYAVGDTAFIGGDTLVVTNHWTKTGNDIQNNNTGKVILPKDSTYFSGIPDEATKVGRIAHINQYGKIEYTSPATLADTLAYSGGGIWQRDSLQGFIYLIDTNDLVGIGTQSPENTLDVRGALNVSGGLFHVGSDIDTDLFVIDPISPTRTFLSSDLDSNHISGAVVVDSSFVMNNDGSYLGYDPLNEIGSEDMSIVYMGSVVDDTSTAYRSQIADGTYTNNIASGHANSQAFIGTTYNSSGDDPNIALTVTKSLTTGSFINLYTNSITIQSDSNVVDGDLYLNNNLNFVSTTATVGQIKQGGNTVFHTYTDNASQPNLFLGNTAGNYTLTGNFNIGIGRGALNTVTSGEANTAVGISSMIDLTTGVANTALGSYSMFEHKKGNLNTAIGWGAMNYDTTGNRNTIIGAQSFNTGYGSSNLMAGYGSGSLLVGDSNVILGAYAAEIASGSNNIIIGYSSAGLELTLSNKLYIENSNADSTGALIFGNFATDKLTVNGDLNVTGMATNDNTFAELFEDASNVTATIATYRTIVSLQTGDFNEAVLTDSTITVNQAGTYLVNYSSSFTHSVNSTLCHISLFVNDVEDTSLEAERKIGTAGDVGSMSGTCLTTIAAGDVLKLKAKSDNNGDLTINHMNFNVTRIK